MLKTELLALRWWWAQRCSPFDRPTFQARLDALVLMMMFCEIVHVIVEVLLFEHIFNLVNRYLEVKLLTHSKVFVESVQLSYSK